MIFLNSCEDAAKKIAEEIKKIIKIKKEAVIGFPGGRSVKAFLPFLENQKIDWHKVHIFMVDERLVSLDDPESNYKLVYDNLLSTLVKKSRISSNNLHPFRVEQGIASYEKELKKYGGAFDIIICGVGEDCHCAALFAQKSILNQSEYFITMDDCPKPPPRRMTSSRKLLLKSKFGLFLFYGFGKEDAYLRFSAGKENVSTCPVMIARKLPDSVILRY